MDDLDLMEMDVRHALATENRNAVLHACVSGLSPVAQMRLWAQLEYTHQLYLNALDIEPYTVERGEAILVFEQASRDLDALIREVELDEQHRLMRVSVWRDVKRWLCLEWRRLVAAVS
ncbi:hypothetical protein L9G74_18925 [Shewanella sp. C32]|uniref:Uncharacterized protein n=1 Tax=Shewanella electrica TaxID=515560 RepID=A0ABT2FQ99_9GAMM|nr:hypothetical protein [Shewanella electrica]MCS4558513.1 hypothetical protein [Shewanella electrica]